LRSLNSILPPQIAVRSLFAVRDDFHPRFSCLAREYEYLIWNAEVRSVLYADRALWVRQALPVSQIHQALQALLGEHDFASFTRAEYRAENTTRYLDKIALLRDDREGELLRFQIRGNAFLHNMIRILVGTVIAMAQNKIPLDMERLLISPDRNAAGPTARPHGLCLLQAYYPPAFASGTPLAALENYPVFRRGK